MKITPLEAPFGAEVTGIDLGPGIDDATLGGLVAALHEHRLLVIRGQDLGKDAYLRFGRRWGEPIPHVLDHLRMPGYPEMMAVGNTEEKDRTDDIRLGAMFWHTDQSYEAEPATATMLHAKVVPEQGGETLFADSFGAYEALDSATKRRLEGLEALHLYGAASGQDGENIAVPLINEAQRDKVPAVKHLIARPHPVTGRTSLYAMAGTPFGIEGLAAAAAAALLATLKTHQLQDRFLYKHRYSVGDITIWDTSQTLHSATQIAVATSAADSRLLYRISVRGKPEVCH